VPGIFTIGLQLLITALEDTMKRHAAAIYFAAFLVLATSITAAAQTPHPSNAQRALQWLQCTQQQPNGQIGNGGNPIARSAEVAISLAAADQDAAGFRHGDTSLADFLKTVTPLDVSKTDTPVGTNGELLMARALEPSTGLTAAPIAQLKLAKSNGEYGSDIFSDALAILGLSAAKQPVGDDAITFLEDKQNPDNHGWSFDNTGEFGSDSNTTALVIQALLAAGVTPTDSHIVNAFKFMSSQFMNGGFVDQADPSKPATDPSNMPDANSDELALQAIVAAGLQADESWRSSLIAAEADLVGRQINSGPDTGALSGFSKLFATTEAPVAFLGRSLTASSKASMQVPLLACPAAAASPTPQPTPTTTPAATTAGLAQTGAEPDNRALIAGVALLILGLGILRRPSRRPGRR
jgi:hypothetical protein